jgi:hypothetical protein
MGPAVVVAIGTYLALMRWHANLSSFKMNSLTEQKVAYDYGEPKAQWERVAARVFQVVGAVVVLLLILAFSVEDAESKP